LLPTRVDAGSLPRSSALGGERHALGVRGRDLQPMIVDFGTDPLLAVYGDDHHGKSSFIRNTIASIVEGRASTKDAFVVLFDPKRRLGDVLSILIEPRDDNPDPADFYETDANMMARRVDQIAQILDKRQPPTSSGWEQRRAWTYEGPKIYLVVDDLDAVPIRQQLHQGVTAGAPAPTGMGPTVATWEPLLRHLPNAADRGLRLIVTHRAAEITAAEVQPHGIPHHLSTQPSTRILLGARSDRDKVGGVKFEVGLPPGRGQVLGGSEDNAGYVQLAAPPA
ncbi:MAG: type VII secretion protein EccC, partial [Dietzia sp.]|nr:type VII secretion protein EccC [Dietzia sp.]